MRSLLLTFAVVVLYSACAISLVVLNKLTLSKFETPIALLWIQALISAVLTRLLASGGIVKAHLDRPIMKCLMDSWQVNLLGALSVVLSAFSLQSIDASVFHILSRSLTIPFTVILSKVFLNDRVSYVSLIGCIFIVFGFYATITLETGSRGMVFTPLGIGLGVASAFIAAYHSVVIKKSVDKTFSDIEMVYYSNLFFVIFGFPLALFEDGNLSNILSDGDLTRMFFLSSFVIGSISIVFNFAVIMQVKFTSPLTHMVSSAFRGVVQNLVCVAVLKESFTGAKLIGTVLVLCGTLLYLAGKIRRKLD